MQDEKNKYIFLPLIISVSLSLGILTGYFYYNKSNTGAGESGKIPSILRYVENFYVDSVSLTRLTEEAIPEILQKLDPHTVYMPAEEAQRESEPLEGGFSGIGIQFNMDNDTVIVIKTIANGPSEKKGLLAGDRIVKVNGKKVAGVKMPSDSVVKRLKGPRGTQVNITIKRPRVIKPLEFTITRDNIPLYSVDVAYMVTEDIGYIKINQFARTTNEEFMAAVVKLKSVGMNKIIIDLRGNGGGYLEAAIQLADQFLENGKSIVYTIGRSKKKEDAAIATPEGIVEKEEVAVLIDEYSASASEILAGALQDNDRGIIIGRRSFGKGLVQKPILLEDRSVIRITVARYYTPTGRCIQKPYNKGEKDYELDIMRRYKNGEFSSIDSIHQNDTLKYYTPKGKIVYGGGGIMPDIFVPLDKENMNDYLTKIQNNGFIYTFAFEYADRNRSSLQQLNNHTDIRRYLEKQNLQDQFIQYVAAKGIKAPQHISEETSHRITVQLYAYIARNLIDNEGFYPIMSEIDNTLHRAVKELSK